MIEYIHTCIYVFVIYIQLDIFLLNCMFQTTKSFSDRYSFAKP